MSAFVYEPPCEIIVMADHARGDKKKKMENCECNPALAGLIDAFLASMRRIAVANLT
jgi:hypothetical protein